MIRRSVPGQRLLALWILACAAGCVAAQDVVTPPRPRAPAALEQPRELLNSERIERAFGSYGIDVLESDAQLRVSNLYSGSGTQRICRTFAVVRYPSVVDPAFAAEHTAIVAGQSIGATFAQSGWTVVKTHRYFGEIDSTPKLAQLMGGIAAPRLAVHVYVFEIVRAQERFEYATIAEVHHPDYLQIDDVREIYGAGLRLPATVDAATGTLLDLVRAKSR